jgi:MFS family permease
VNTTVPSRSITPEIRLGLRNNLPQFALLVIINAFVGAMVGLERAILPAIAEREFHLAARTAVLSFIVVFGVTKAVTNYLAGRWSDATGRKRVLVAGWLVAVPVPFLLMWAPSWSRVLWANALLGASQGLTWSTTVIMKIDLPGGLPQLAYVAYGAISAMRSVHCWPGLLPISQGLEVQCRWLPHSPSRLDLWQP